MRAQHTKAKQARMLTRATYRWCLQFQHPAGGTVKVEIECIIK